MLAPQPPQSGPDGVFATWGFIEWALGAAWVVGLAVAGFVWRLTVKIDDLASRTEILEKEAEMRERADTQRHNDNIHLMRGIQQQLSGVIVRIDNIYNNMPRNKGGD